MNDRDIEQLVFALHDAYYELRLHIVCAHGSPDTNPVLKQAEMVLAKHSAICGARYSGAQLPENPK